MGRVAGRVMIGRFVRDVQATKRVEDGERVPMEGMREVVLAVGPEGEEEYLRASYFVESYGSEARMVTTMREVAPQVGEWVAVRISAAAKAGREGTGKAYLNERALSVHRLEELVGSSGHNGQPATAPAEGNGYVAPVARPMA